MVQHFEAGFHSIVRGLLRLVSIIFSALKGTHKYPLVSLICCRKSRSLFKSIYKGLSEQSWKSLQIKGSPVHKTPANMGLGKRSNHINSIVCNLTLYNKISFSRLEFVTCALEILTCAFAQGLREGDFFQSLAKKPPRDYDEFLTRVEKHINIEAQKVRQEHSTQPAVVER